MKKIMLFGFILLSFMACREDTDISGEVVVTTDPPVIFADYAPVVDLVSGTLTGIIIDEDDNPVENALVRLRGNTYTTDEYGLFVAKNVQMDRNGTFYTVEKEGYFKGSRRFFPQEGAMSYTKVQLLDLTTIGSFQTSEGGIISSPEGIQLNFSANSIKNADGSLYSGDVSVAARWLDPTAPNLTDIMPGNLQGLSRFIEEVNLASYGMMAVELFAADGAKLNLADGQTAELSFPIPSELSASAPEEIPLWSYEDEVYGIWGEEGMATRQGDMYVGTVSHFSFWNCDAPFDLVYLTGTLHTDSGTPIANAYVKVQIAGTGICSGGYTNDYGEFSGKMPKDEVLVISVGTNADCIFESITVGPYSVDTDMGVLSLNSSGDAFDVSGSVVDCAGNPVTEGYVTFSYGNQTHSIYLNGDSNFDVGLLNCDNATDMQITAIDGVNFVQSDEITYAITPVVNAGSIAACGNQLPVFFTLNVGAETHTYITPSAFLELPTGNEYLYINATDSLGTNAGISLSFNDGNVGPSDINNLGFLNITLAPPVWAATYNLNCQGGAACTAITSFSSNITLNDGPGGNVEGNFSGVADFTDDMGVTIPGVSFSGNYVIPIQ